MKTGVLFAATAALLATGSWSGVASAQERMSTTAVQEAPRELSKHSRARLAGLQALHLCSGIFQSEMSEATVRASFQPGTRTRAPIGETIDRDRHFVSVPYDDKMPPRLAVWRPGLGCTQLPIGATLDAAGTLRRLPPGVAPPALDARAWPTGDAGATSRLDRKRSRALEAVLDGAFADEDGPYAGKTWGVVVMKDGKIVAERYDPGFGPHIAARTNSMCKSLSVTLVGAAVQDGLVDVNRPAFLTEWQTPGDPRGRITLDDTLRMASGLYTEDDNNPQPELYGSGAPAYEVSALNMVNSMPGKRFVYAGSDTILSTRAVRQAMADDAAFIAWPYQEVLGRSE